MKIHTINIIMMHQSYIALGSNQDDPIQQIKNAIRALQQDKNIGIVAYSKLYKSKTVGPKGQPDCINGVIKVNTNLNLECLLDRLQTIEINQKRLRTVYWGPRTIDLDILLYDSVCMKTRRLTIPHKEMHKRHFVLLPLSDINYNIEIPDIGAINKLIGQCDLSDIQPIQNAWNQIG